MAAYPYTTTLNDIPGFAGGTVGDQLGRPSPPKRKFLQPPPPPGVAPAVPQGVETQPAPLPTAQPPSAVNPFNLETAGVRPPVTAAGPVGGGDTQGGGTGWQPAEQPNSSSGMNSVGKALETYRKNHQDVPLATAPVDTGGSVSERDTQPTYPNQSAPGMHLSQLGTNLAMDRELRRAPVSAPVTTDKYGLPQVGAETPMTKKHGILMGLLQGALAGGAAGGWKGALGGAAVGGIAGGVNPKLEYALERDQEIQRNQRDTDQQISNRAKTGAINVQQSQAEENRAQAARALRGTPHYERDADGNVNVYYDDDAYPVTDKRGNQVKGADPDAAQKESVRYHDLVIKQREDAAKAKDKDKVDVTVGGKTYRVSQSAAANIKVRQQQNAKKPNPGREAAIEAVIQEEAESDALGRRKDTDEAISKLEEQRDKLTKHDDGTDKVDLELPKAQIAQLDKSIADLRKESDNQQKIAETAASDKRKAEAKAKANGETVQWKGKSGQQPAKQQSKSTPSQRPWSKAKWKAANPNGDEEAAAAAAAKRGDRVVP